MDTIRSVGIVGLGLIGGSLARDLQGLGVRVHAQDTDPDSIADARARSIIDSVLDDSLEAAANLDVLVLAVPLDAAIAIMERAAHALLRVPLIIDTCSTKATIMAAAKRLGLADRFVGAHPLAGDHRHGWIAARSGLFANAVAYICPHVNASSELVQRARLLWEHAGAVPQVIAAEEHDRLLAWTSHLPQVASTAVARALAGQGIGPEQLGPGGRDVTRLAASPADLWTTIALDNAGNLDIALSRMERELAGLRMALAARDAERVLAFFSNTSGDNDLAGVVPHRRSCSI